jgi:hypothetical protein
MTTARLRRSPPTSCHTALWVVTDGWLVDEKGADLHWTTGESCRTPAAQSEGAFPNSRGRTGHCGRVQAWARRSMRATGGVGTSDGGRLGPANDGAQVRRRGRIRMAGGRGPPTEPSQRRCPGRSCSSPRRTLRPRGPWRPVRWPSRPGHRSCLRPSPDRGSGR